MTRFVLVVALFAATAEAQIAPCGSATCVGNDPGDVKLGGTLLETRGARPDGGVAALRPVVPGASLALQSVQPTGTSVRPDVIIGSTNVHDGGTLVSFRNGNIEVATISAAGAFSGSSGGGGCVGNAQSIACQFVDAGTILVSGTVTADRFYSTLSSAGGAADGGANFQCNQNPGASSPCVANFTNVVEIGGLHHGTSEDDSANIYLGALEERDGGSLVDILQCYGAGGGCAERAMFRFMYDGTFKAAGIHTYLNTANSSSGARIHSPNGGIYLDSQQGEILTWNETAGTIMSWYTGGGATLVGELGSGGRLDLADGTSSNKCTLDGASPSVCTVTTFAGARCICAPVGTTAAIAAGGCAVSLSSTTLTVTGPNGGNYDVNVVCL